ncbi:hypothetical protein DBIPINDM_001593 [Mesorhizobium sp. AR02]|uniref:hypothetical protein n=1 Tax=Mesorhizobium sp. AR02 TaxID=2865837 RepID=UPI00215DF2AE|nr:hypothetical protein [Mesorhizobium sp. AR02]UVK55102.1 hypothetical protein DBIPINDM_001593 [Mesorhizobium sp. AR02]
MNRLHVSILTIGTLALGIIAAEAKPVQLTADQIGVIEQTIRYLLQDRTNVLFGKPAATTSPTGSIIVCGRYNAKSGFAGYSGETAYRGQFDSADTGTKYLPAFDIITMPENQSETDDLIKRCASLGVDVPPIGK